MYIYVRIMKKERYTLYLKAVVENILFYGIGF